MAKDRRNKVRPTLDLESSKSSESRSSANASRIASNNTSRNASGNRTQKKRPSVPDRSVRQVVSARKVASNERPSQNQPNRRRKKRKLSRAALIIRWTLAVLAVVSVVFVCVAGVKLIAPMFFPEPMDKVPPIDPTQYDTTPVENEGKVAYYLVGILGEKNNDTAMLSVVCHNKAKNTVNILQLPQATYIETADQWAVDTLGRVFKNPKALDWCDTCRKRLYEPEIEEGEKAIHRECGTEVTLKKGSAVSGLVDFVNDQLGLPVDDYFLLPQGAVTVLVDAVGGVDVQLGDHYELAGNNYEPGVQTLSGDAAADYICYTDGTVDRDVTRMLRQREVFGALLTRIFRMEDDVVAEDVVEEVMDSKSAIRTEAYTEDICELIKVLKKAGVDGMTVQLLPGEITSDSDDDTVYSVHKEELLNVLNTEFNPYGAKINASDLLIPELTNSGSSDVRKASLAESVVDQTGKLLSTDETE